MKIIIPNLPPSVSKKRLTSTVEDILDGKFRLPFTEENDLVSADILEIKQGNSRSGSNYGLLVVRPESAGQWLIAKLRKTQLNGKKMLCREYHDRAVVSKGPPGDDERRRDNLNIKKVAGSGAKAIGRGMEKFATTRD